MYRTVMVRPALMCVYGAETLKKVTMLHGGICHRTTLTLHKSRNKMKRKKLPLHYDQMAVGS